MAYKEYDFRDFRIGELIVQCYTQNTSYGFRHVAKVRTYCDSDIIATAKACYYNRTWERWKYENVIKKALESIDDSGAYLEIVKNSPDGREL